MDTVQVIVKQVRAAFVIIPVQALLTTLTTHAPVVTAKTTPCQDIPFTFLDSFFKQWF